MEQTKRFGKALRLARQLQGCAREDFISVSSPNYLGEVERGEKRVTVEKLCELAEVLGIHPASLVIFACLNDVEGEGCVRDVAQRVEREVNALVDAAKRVHKPSGEST